MRPLIHLANTLRADAEGLIRLVARPAAPPVRPQALEKRIVLVDVAAGVERCHRASLVLKMFEVRDDDARSNRSNRGKSKQRINDTILCGVSHKDLFHKPRPSKGEEIFRGGPGAVPVHLAFAILRSRTRIVSEAPSTLHPKKRLSQQRERFAKPPPAASKVPPQSPSVPASTPAVQLQQSVRNGAASDPEFPPLAPLASARQAATPAEAPGHLPDRSSSAPAPWPQEKRGSGTHCRDLSETSPPVATAECRLSSRRRSQPAPAPRKK